MLASQNIAHLSALTQWLEHQAHVTEVSDLVQVPPSASGGAVFSLLQLTHLYHSGQYQRVPALRTWVAATTSGGITLISLQVNTLAGSGQDQELIAHLRALAPQRFGFTTLVGGTRVVSLDFNNALYSRFWRALLFVLLATYLLLFALFRSVILPLKAIVMNGYCQLGNIAEQYARIAS